MTGIYPKCAIWGTDATDEPKTGLYRVIDSPRAGGRYRITGSAETIIENFTDEEKVAVTSWLVEQRRLGSKCPRVNVRIIKEVFVHKPPAVHDRADMLLMLLAKNTKNLGEKVLVIPISLIGEWHDIEIFHEVLAWTKSLKLDEVKYLVKYVETKGWIEKFVAGRAVLTPSGYAHLAKLDGENIQSKQAFVAMWFDPSMTEAYEYGIKPAIKAAGYKPLRLDQAEHNNRIDDEIIAGIRRSRFLVADFTHGDQGARGGVYYEAGFAHGLNIKVIFTCREDAREKVHLDIRQQNFIFWETPDDLRKALQARIEAVIGDGPNKRAV